MKHTKNVMISFSAPTQQREALRRKAESIGFSQAELLRAMLQEYLDRNPETVRLA